MSQREGTVGGPYAVMWWNTASLDVSYNAEGLVHFAEFFFNRLSKSNKIPTFFTEWCIKIDFTKQDTADKVLRRIYFRQRAALCSSLRLCTNPSSALAALARCCPFSWILVGQFWINSSILVPLFFFPPPPALRLPRCPSTLGQCHFSARARHEN